MAATTEVVNLTNYGIHLRLRSHSQWLSAALWCRLYSTGWKISLSLALFSAFFIIVLYRLAFHPLSKFPGPFFAKVSGRWRNTRYWRGTWHDDILEAHHKYGRVVRIAPNELSIVDEQVSKHLYGHGHNAVKISWYNTWEIPDAAPGVFATQDKKLHAFLRKRLSGAYSITSIVKLEEYAVLI